MPKYDPLKHYLNGHRKIEITMAFREIEQIIGAPLPKSAYVHRAWWANEQVGSHVHCRSWLDASYSLDQVDLSRRVARFRRLAS